MFNEDDIKLKEDWQKLRFFIAETIGKKPTDLNSILFLIGVQELGQGQKVFTKEQKQDLMHIAICRVLSIAGFYELDGIDEEGWPHWKLIKKLPFNDLLLQEKLLKHFTLEYFKQEIGFEPNGMQLI